MNSASSSDLAKALGALSSLSAATVLDQSVDCVKLIDLGGHIRYMNANGLCAMEIDSIQSFFGTLWSDLWPHGARHEITASYDTAAAGGTGRFRAFCATVKGTQRWWDVSVSMVRDDGGEHVGYLSISRDVTEQQLSREALAVAVAEMTHRLKNTYMMISSLLTVFARGDAANEAFATLMRTRIGAIGAAQALFVTGEAACELETLVPALVAPFDNPACRVVVEASGPAVVDRGRADAIALVLGELAVNAGKHGALAHGGEIHVSTIIDDSELTIVWDERSARPPLNRTRDGGQGLALIQRIVTARKGRIDTEWNASGLRTKLTFPLPNQLAQLTSG